MRSGLSAPVGSGPSWIIIILTPARSWQNQNQRLKAGSAEPVPRRSGSSYLQLLDGVAAAADHQPHLAGRDQHLLHRGAAVAITMETRPVPTPLHDLDQQPLRLPGQNQNRYRAGSTGTRTRRTGSGRTRSARRHSLDALWSSRQ